VYYPPVTEQVPPEPGEDRETAADGHHRMDQVRAAGKCRRGDGHLETLRPARHAVLRQNRNRVPVSQPGFTVSGPASEPYILRPGYAVSYGRSQLLVGTLMALERAAC